MWGWRSLVGGCRCSASSVVLAAFVVGFWQVCLSGFYIVIQNLYFSGSHFRQVLHLGGGIGSVLAGIGG
jgi:hypothetical protein